MMPKWLPNGNLLVPSTVLIHGETMVGMKEVKPGSSEYLEWCEPTAQEGTTMPEVKLSKSGRFTLPRLVGRL